MNEHAGAASALSVLIVGVFAILLHQPDRPPTATRPPSASPSPLASAVTPAESSQSPSPAKNPPAPAPLPEEREPARPTDPIPTSKPSVPAPEVLSPQIRPAPIPPASPSPSVKSRLPTPAKTPFTVVQPGEKLADVATRIYGTADAVVALWKANRDQVAQVDSPLLNGTLLRTP